MTESVGTKRRKRHGRKSVASANAKSSTATAASSATATISGTAPVENGDTRPKIGDRVVVKHERHGTGKITRDTTLAVDYIEYVCDCHRQFRMARREYVTILKRKA